VYVKNTWRQHLTGAAAVSSLFSVDTVAISAKQQSDAPQARKTNNRINYTADNSSLTAEDPGHQIEFKNTDKAPVQ